MSSQEALDIAAHQNFTAITETVSVTITEAGAALEFSTPVEIYNDDDVLIRASTLKVYCSKLRFAGGVGDFSIDTPQEADHADNGASSPISSPSASELDSSTVQNSSAQHMTSAETPQKSVNGFERAHSSLETLSPLPPVADTPVSPWVAENFAQSPMAYTTPGQTPAMEKSTAGGSRMGFHPRASMGSMDDTLVNTPTEDITRLDGRDVESKKKKTDRRSTFDTETAYLPLSKMRAAKEMHKRPFWQEEEDTDCFELGSNVESAPSEPVVPSSAPARYPSKQIYRPGMEDEYGPDSFLRSPPNPHPRSQQEPERGPTGPSPCRALPALEDDYEPNASFPDERPRSRFAGMFKPNPAPQSAFMKQLEYTRSKAQTPVPSPFSEMRQESFRESTQIFENFDAEAMLEFAHKLDALKLNNRKENRIREDYGDSPLPIRRSNIDPSDPRRHAIYGSVPNTPSSPAMSTSTPRYPKVPRTPPPRKQPQRTQPRHNPPPPPLPRKQSRRIRAAQTQSPEHSASRPSAPPRMPNPLFSAPHLPNSQMPNPRVPNPRMSASPLARPAPVRRTTSTPMIGRGSGLAKSRHAYVEDEVEAEGAEEWYSTPRPPVPSRSPARLDRGRGEDRERNAQQGEQWNG